MNMVEKKKVYLGILILTILLGSGIVYVNWPAAGLKMRVDIDKSTFYVLEDGRWRIGGREVSVGSLRYYDSERRAFVKANRDLSATSVLHEYDTELNTTSIFRVTEYRIGPTVVDTYVFHGNVSSKEMFPVDHKIEVFGAKGYVWQYEVRDLVYSGPTVKNVGSPQSFGRNMKVEWDGGWYWNTLYKSGILKVRYKIESDYEVFYVKLFDPDCPGGTGKCDCGNTLTANYTMQATDNLTNCIGHGLQIGGDNIILDCDGRSIDGNNGSVGWHAGISVGSDNSFTAINCNITDFPYGVYASASQYLNLTYLNIKNASDTGIALVNITDSNVSHSIINVTGRGISMNYGQQVTLFNNSVYNNLRGIYAYRTNFTQWIENTARNCTATSNGCFNIDQTNHSLIHNNTCYDGNRSCYFASECVDVNLTYNYAECTIGSSQHQCATGINHGGAYSYITNNTIVGFHWNIWLTDGDQSIPLWAAYDSGKNLTVNDNVVVNFSKAGIYCRDCRNFTILNNTVTGNSTSGSVGFYAVNVSSSVFSNNSVTGCSVHVGLITNSIINSSNDLIDSDKISVQAGSVFDAWFLTEIITYKNVSDFLYVYNSTDIVLNTTVNDSYSSGEFYLQRYQNAVLDWTINITTGGPRTFNLSFADSVPFKYYFNSSSENITNYSYWNGYSWVYNLSYLPEFFCHAWEDECEPRFQDANNDYCFYNITNNGTTTYEKITVRMNQTLDDIQFKAAINSTYSTAVGINTSNFTLINDFRPDDEVQVCLWIDLTNPSTGGDFALFFEGWT